MISGILAHDEKGRFQMPGSEQVEKLRGQRGVGSVVERESDKRSIDMDGIERNRRFRWRRGTPGPGHRRTGTFGDWTGRFWFLSERCLPKQRRDSAEDDKLAKKHETRGQDGKTCVYLADATLNASQCAAVVAKGPQIASRESKLRAGFPV